MNVLTVSLVRTMLPVLTQLSPHPHPNSPLIPPQKGSGGKKTVKHLYTNLHNHIRCFNIPGLDNCSGGCMQNCVDCMVLRRTDGIVCHEENGESWQLYSQRFYGKVSLPWIYPRWTQSYKCIHLIALIETMHMNRHSTPHINVQSRLC